MKIATWNVERLIKKKNAKVIKEITFIDADILVLTETSSKIDLSHLYKFHWQTDALINENVFPKGFYAPEENRVTIWSKFSSHTSFETFNKFTSICQEIATPIGNIIVYGTIIGIEGNRRPSFLEDLKLQLKDFGNLSKENNFCLIGDLNITFSDGTYFTEEGRGLLTECFKKNQLINLTSAIPENIDHIVLSRQIFKNQSFQSLQVWNSEKLLSDHIGVEVIIL